MLTTGRADYNFQPRDPVEAVRQAATKNLALYVIGPPARTPDEIALRTSLRERLLTPQATTVAEYRERLRRQGLRQSVPQMRTYPVVLNPSEDPTVYEAQFELWAEGSRHLPSMEALRASFSEVDVRVERRLRFEYTELRAKRHLSAGFQSHSRVGATHHAPLSTPAFPHREGGVAVAQGHCS
ncbi:uncharacterized protein IUM83_06923 [Phytophthora cinnamomi]|uniref:uncharacterized protein n=1 Tax=Phytophthora cinnamomi TaxID=4785 RepID=UPI00355A84D4|nr:hypothetical protein IUM83_06923 [Phytophthora cinnamomi]